MSNEVEERETAPLHKILLASNGKHGAVTASDEYVQIANHGCRNLIIFTGDVGVYVVQRSLEKNDAGTYVDTNTDYVPIPANQAFCFSGMRNASEFWVKSADDSEITIRYRMEW